MASQRESFIRDLLIPAVVGEFIVNAADVAGLDVDELKANVSAALQRALTDDEAAELRQFLADLNITTTTSAVDTAQSPFILSSGYHMPDDENSGTSSPTNDSPSNSETVVRSSRGIPAIGLGQRGSGVTLDFAQPADFEYLPRSSLVAFKVDSISFEGEDSGRTLVRWDNSGGTISLRADADGDLYLTNGTSDVYFSGIRTLRVPVQTGDEIVMGMFPNTTDGSTLDAAYTINGQSENIVDTGFATAPTAGGGSVSSSEIGFGIGRYVQVSKCRAIAHPTDSTFYPSHGFLAGLAGNFDTDYVLGLVSETTETRESVSIANLDISDALVIGDGDVGTDQIADDAVTLGKLSEVVRARVPAALEQFLQALTIDATASTTEDAATPPFDIATGWHLEGGANLSPGSNLGATLENISVDGAVFGLRMPASLVAPTSSIGNRIVQFNVRQGSIAGQFSLRLNPQLGLSVRAEFQDEVNMTIPDTTLTGGETLVFSFAQDGSNLRLRYSIDGSRSGEIAYSADGIDISSSNPTGISFMADTTSRRFIAPLSSAQFADYPSEEDLAAYAGEIDTLYTLGLVTAGGETIYTINSVSIAGLDVPLSSDDLTDGSITRAKLSDDLKAQIAAAAHRLFTEDQVEEINQFLADLSITSTSTADDSATAPFTLATGYHMPADETTDATSPTNDSPSSDITPVSRTIGNNRYVRIGGAYNPLRTVLAFRVDSIVYGEGAAHQVLAAFRVGDTDSVVEARVDSSGDLFFTDGNNDTYAAGIATSRVRVSAGDEIVIAFRSDDDAHLTALYTINGLDENDVQTRIENHAGSSFNIDFGVDEMATLSKCRAIAAPTNVNPTHGFVGGLYRNIDAEYTLGLVTETTTTTESVAIANLELEADSVEETMLAEAVRTKLNATGGGTARSWVSGKFSTTLGVHTISVPDGMTIGDFTRCAITYSTTTHYNDTTGNIEGANDKLIFEEIPRPILSGSGNVYTQGLGRGATNTSLRIARQSDAGDLTSFTCEVVDINTSSGGGRYNTGFIGGVWWY